MLALSEALHAPPTLGAIPHQFELPQPTVDEVIVTSSQNNRHLIDTSTYREQSLAAQEHGKDPRAPRILQPTGVARDSMQPAAAEQVAIKHSPRGVDQPARHRPSRRAPRANQTGGAARREARQMQSLGETDSGSWVRIPPIGVSASAKGPSMRGRLLLREVLAGDGRGPTPLVTGSKASYSAIKLDANGDGVDDVYVVNFGQSNQLFAHHYCDLSEHLSKFDHICFEV